MQRIYRHRILRAATNGALTGAGNHFSPSWDLAEVSERMPSEHIGFERIGIFIRITAVGGTGPTMDVALEISEDNTNWETLANSLTGLNAVSVRTALLAATYPVRFVRLRFTLGGTTPSFTFEARVKVIV